ncbi:MAG: hypothetical protein MJ209_07275 [archaeon]|nr:hypothetical protein [archaeon]
MRKKNNDGKIVVILIIALIAFAVGAAVGINVSIHGLDTADMNATHEVNVTHQMTHPTTSDSSGGFVQQNVSQEEVNYEYQSQMNEYSG